MTFDDVIGQAEVKRRLMQMAEEHRLPNALMLCGPAGSGKMPLMLAFASYLLGNSPLLKNWEHPDLHFVFPVIRGKNVTSDHKMESDDYIKEWRSMISVSPYFTPEQWLTKMDAANQQIQIGVGDSNALMRKLNLKSYMGGLKICLIWLPEYMNAECANKMLKMLEEPPSQTIFLMVCEEPDKLLETIRSRVQRIDTKPIEEQEIKEGLMSRRGLSEEDAKRTAHIANGSWVKALEELVPDNEEILFLDMFQMLMRKAYQRNVKDLKKWSDAIHDYGRERQKRMLTYFLRLIRENFMYNFHQPELNYMNFKEEQFSTRFARFINEANVIEFAESLQKAIDDISSNANAKIVFFDLALKTTQLLNKR